jgi:arsenite methyltransferase
MFHIEDARTFLNGQGIDVDAIASEVDGKFMSAFICATKPKSCRSPGCCSPAIS